MRALEGILDTKEKAYRKKRLRQRETQFLAELFNDALWLRENTKYNK